MLYLSHHPNPSRITLVSDGWIMTESISIRAQRIPPQLFDQISLHTRFVRGKVSQWRRKNNVRNVYNASLKRFAVLVVESYFSSKLFKLRHGMFHTGMYTHRTSWKPAILKTRFSNVGFSDSQWIPIKIRRHFGVRAKKLSMWNIHVISFKKEECVARKIVLTNPWIRLTEFPLKNPIEKSLFPSY